MLTETFKKINELETQSNELLRQQGELYESLDLDKYSKDDIYKTIRSAEDSLYRIFLADHFRQRFNTTVKEYGSCKRNLEKNRSKVYKS